MSNSALIAKMKNELTALEYTPVGIGNYCAYARQFLEYLTSQQIAVAAVTPELVVGYLNAARKERERRRGRALGPTWQSIPRAGIHILLRLTLGQWPPEPELIGPEATLRHAICSSYEMWLQEEKGLADASIRALLWEGRCRRLAILSRRRWRRSSLSLIDRHWKVPGITLCYRFSTIAARGSRKRSICVRLLSGSRRQAA